MLVILVSVTLVQVDKRRQARLREESAENLGQLWRALSEGWDEEAAEIVVRWPPRSATTGQLTPELTSLTMQALLKSESQSAFVSPAHPNAERMRRDPIMNAILKRKVM